MTRIEAEKADRNGYSITIINLRIVNKTGLNNFIHVSNEIHPGEKSWKMMPNGKIKIYNARLCKINNKIKQLLYRRGWSAVLEPDDVRSNKDTLQVDKLVMLL